MVANHILKMDREQLVSALKDRLPLARRIDSDNMKVHRKAEREFEKTVKQRAREVMGMTYAQIAEEAGKRYGEINLTRNLNTPSCPISRVQRIQTALRDLELTKQQEFTIGGDRPTWPELYDLLTYDPDVPTTMC